MSSKRISQYDSIRACATILVLIGHSSAITLNGEKLFYTKNTIFASKIAELVYYLIYTFHMPLFVALSGCIFELTYKCNRKNYILNRIRRLLIPYFGCLLFLLIPIRLYTGYFGEIGFRKMVTKIVKSIFFAIDINYLWFLLVIFEINILFYCLYGYLFKNKKLFFIFLCILCIASIFGNYYPEDIIYQINRFCELSIWFMFGIVFEKERAIIINNFFRKYSILMVTIIFIMAVSIRYMIDSDIYYVRLHNYTYIIKYIRLLTLYLAEFSGIIIVLLLSFMGAFNCLNNSIFAKKSFQLYLYHVPIKLLILKIIYDIVPVSLINNIYYILIIVFLFIIEIIGSLMIDFILTHIKLIKNLIG